MPDAAIHLVDFSTLPTASTGYLVDAPIAIHCLLAERDLVEPRAEPGGNSLLAVGAPDFDRVEILSDDRATEAAFKAMAPGRRVLHLATHGFFLDRTCGASSRPSTPATARTRGAQLLEASPLLRSGLVLAGANQRAQANADEEDGIVTAEEIAGLNLSDTQWPSSGQSTHPLYWSGFIATGDWR